MLQNCMLYCDFLKKMYLFIFLFLPFKNSKGTQNLVSEAKNSGILCLVFQLPTWGVLMWESMYHLQIMKLNKVFSFFSRTVPFFRQHGIENYFIWHLLYVRVKEGVLWLKRIVLSILIVKSEGLTNSGTYNNSYNFGGHTENSFMGRICGLVAIRSVYLSDFSGSPCEAESIACHSGVLATSCFIAVQ